MRNGLWLPAVTLIALVLWLSQQHPTRYYHSRLLQGWAYRPAWQRQPRLWPRLQRESPSLSHCQSHCWRRHLFCLSLFLCHFCSQLPLVAAEQVCCMWKGSGLMHGHVVCDYYDGVLSVFLDVTVAVMCAKWHPVWWRLAVSAADAGWLLSCWR